MIKKLILSMITLSLFSGVIAQEERKLSFGINFHGVVKSDFFTDSRQTVSAREGHFMLWPMPIRLDSDGKDINAGSNTNFLPVQSQISGRIHGPDVLGAQTSGLIEGDFFGTLNGTINLLRMRHAFIKLNWTKAELLMGQFWHPLFNTASFPGTVSFNTGAPIAPFSRDPQIRFSYSVNKFKIMAAAVEQRDYPSFGPDGPSSHYLRNSAIPELYSEITYIKNLNENRVLSTGVLFGFKTIRPRLESVVNNNIYKVDETVSSIAASAFINLKLKPVTLKLAAIYGENLSDVLSITGYAVTAIEDTISGLRSYAPTAGMTFWTDMHTNGTRWQAGIFAGVSRNMGTTSEMQNPAADIYGLTNNITLLYRISPRLIYNTTGRIRFAAEVEYTNATFGVADNTGIIIRDQNGLPVKTESVGNTRILLSAYYFF